MITPVLAALQRLKSLNPAAARDCFFHYYGPHGEHVQAEARRLKVADNVALHGNVPRPEALSAVKGSNLALVITGVLDEDRTEDNGIIPAKLYEAIGLGARVLLIAPPNSDARAILKETNCGTSFKADEIEGMACYLNNLVLNSPAIHSTPEPYSWSHLVKRLDRNLRTILCEGDSHGSTVSPVPRIKTRESGNDPGWKVVDATKS